MPQYEVTVYLNVGEDNFDGYTPTAPLATDTDLRLRVTASTPQAAADAAFTLGNRTGTEATHLAGWPADVRSVSVGDLLKITDGTHTVFYAVTRAGFTPVGEPVNPLVPLPGTRATSRPHPGHRHRRSNPRITDAPGGGPATHEETTDDHR